MFGAGSDNLKRFVGGVAAHQEEEVVVAARDQPQPVGREIERVDRLDMGPNMLRLGEFKSRAGDDAGESGETPDENAVVGASRGEPESIIGKVEGMDSVFVRTQDGDDVPDVEVDDTYRVVLVETGHSQVSFIFGEGTGEQLAIASLSDLASHRMVQLARIEIPETDRLVVTEADQLVDRSAEKQLLDRAGMALRIDEELGRPFLCNKGGDGEASCGDN